jgi:hypothetical protein
MMRIDTYDLDIASRVLWHINPAVSKYYASEEHFKEYINSCAYNYMHNSTTFSTAGFHLTAYDGSDGERVVRISISAYAVAKYLGEINNNG